MIIKKAQSHGPSQKLSIDKNVYIDPPTTYNHKGPFSHMMSQDLDTLHEMARNLGIKKCWFENKRNMNRPHYDVKEIYYQAAINLGAIPLSLKEYSRKAEILFGPYPWKKTRQTTLL